MTALELLAPARNTDIGFAAIDCGADAVYIAGPAFGARQAAGNSLEDIQALCSYAHRFGARIFATVNTLVLEQEMEQAQSLVRGLEEAGVDALIVQDPAVLSMSTRLPLHASTQCAIRTAEKARFLESLGYGRLVLERQLSLEQIKSIRDAVDVEIECFVHGALCVCYSGECYLSEYLTGRSANRGACAQPCRSLYDLEDASGKVLLRNKALLSLKDFNLLHRLEDLADTGVCSFKIEGRLKSESYVRNVVKAYSEALDSLVERHPERYCRASYGHVRGGFAPDVDKTFNRGYTALFLDGQRGQWASMDAPKSMGEYVGTVARVQPGAVQLQAAKTGLELSNGDGFAFTAPDGSIVGFRADTCEGFTLRGRIPQQLRMGMKLYRNISAAFERQLEAAKPVREMDVRVEMHLAHGTLSAKAVSEDGREASLSVETGAEAAREPERMLQSLTEQMAKRSGHYCFLQPQIQVEGTVPFLPISAVNGLRRELAAALDSQPVHARPLPKGTQNPAIHAPETLDYKANIANSADRALFAARGTQNMEDAYELSHRSGVEYMRSKYCIRHELGLCPKQGKVKAAEPLLLRNGKQRLRLHFHCTTCEMTVE